MSGQPQRTSLTELLTREVDRVATLRVHLLWRRHKDLHMPDVQAAVVREIRPIQKALNAAHAAARTENVVAIMTAVERLRAFDDGGLTACTEPTRTSATPGAPLSPIAAGGRSSASAT